MANLNWIHHIFHKVGGSAVERCQNSLMNSIVFRNSWYSHCAMLSEWDFVYLRCKIQVIAFDNFGQFHIARMVEILYLANFTKQEWLKFCTWVILVSVAFFNNILTAKICYQIQKANRLANDTFLFKLG